MPPRKKAPAKEASGVREGKGARGGQPGRSRWAVDERNVLADDEARTGLSSQPTDLGASRRSQSKRKRRKRKKNADNDDAIGRLTQHVAPKTPGHFAASVTARETEASSSSDEDGTDLGEKKQRCERSVCSYDSSGDEQVDKRSGKRSANARKEMNNSFGSTNAPPKVKDRVRRTSNRCQQPTILHAIDDDAELLSPLTGASPLRDSPSDIAGRGSPRAAPGRGSPGRGSPGRGSDHLGVDV